MTALCFRAFIAAALLFLAASLCLAKPSIPRSYDDGSAILNAGLPSVPFKHLGQYSPRYAVADGYHKALPAGCDVVQLSSLERHGARHFTASALKKAQATLSKLQAAIAGRDEAAGAKLPKELAFARDAKLPSGSDSLIPYGALQAWYSGRSAAGRYPHLARHSPFTRASGDIDGSDRVVRTAQYWRAGFEGAAVPFSRSINSSDAVRSYASTSLPLPDVVLSEKDGQNNTLHVDTCAAEEAQTGAATEDGAQAAFFNSTLLRTVGARLTSRLEAAGIRNLTLSGADLLNLANLCAFETLIGAKLLPNYRVELSPSGFCGLYRNDDWPLLEYMYDVGKWTGAGYGDKFYRALGQGYLRELLARLTNTPPLLSPPTSLNTTVDGQPRLFPTADGRVYLDTSHDNSIGPIVAALGLFDGPALSTDGVVEPRSWHFAHIAPFGGKIEFEKIRCRASLTHHGHHGSKGEKHGSGGKQEEVYVRIRANGALQRATASWCPTIADGYGKAESYLCPLASFKEHLAFVQTDDEWRKCYA